MDEVDSGPFWAQSRTQDFGYRSSNYWIEERSVGTVTSGLDDVDGGSVVPVHPTVDVNYNVRPELPLTPDCVSVNPPELALLLKAGLEKYLLIDSRSFLEYNTSHIQQSVNVCCSKLMKRRLQRNKVHIKDLLTQTCHLDVDEFADIIVYDQCTEKRSNLTDDTFLCVLLQKLAQSFTSVALLKGGFLAFQAMYPSLCESKSSSARCPALTSLSQPCLPVSNVGPTRILPFLYLGSQEDAMTHDIVQVNEISYILNVSTTCVKPPYISDGHFLRIPVNDNYCARLQPYFTEAFQFLDKVRESNGCVLVHCLAGISRSPTLAIAYIMKHLGMSSDDAYRYVKDKRPTISPNFNFLGQLLEYEKQLKREREFNNNSTGGQKPERINYIMDLSSHSPSSPVAKAVRPFMFKPRSQGPQKELSMHNVSKNKKEQKSTKTSATPHRAQESIFPSSQESTIKQSNQSSQVITQETCSHSTPFPFPNEPSRKSNPSTCTLTFEPTRRLPRSYSAELSISKSLTEITESAESNLSPLTPSSGSQESISPTSCSSQGPVMSPFPCGETSTISKSDLMSPFPCGETSTISKSDLMSPFPCGETSTISKSDQTVSFPSASACLQFYSGNEQTQEPMPVSPRRGLNLMIKSQSCQFQPTKSPSTPVDFLSMTKSASEQQSPINPSVTPKASSFFDHFPKSRGNKPLRTSLSLSLSPVTPVKPSASLFSSGENKIVSNEPCETQASRNIHKLSGHIRESSSSIPTYSERGSVKATHSVKLKSFTFASATSLSAQSPSTPTTSLAKLSFGSPSPGSSQQEKDILRDSGLGDSLQMSSCESKTRAFVDKELKFSSFPTTSLDRLNFTPCFSSKPDDSMDTSAPRTSGVKRPLNLDLEQDDNMSPASVHNVTSTSDGNITTNSPSVESTTVCTPPKVVVRKRDGRGKRPTVRPNSIAFSTYPTFDLGSDCQDSPHSSSSTTSQDDSSESYIQNGKKSKPSEYVSDVKFRLGRYSEREVYRQITAAMETAMMKSQVFEASRKSRSMDDILNSEDDSSSPNCECSSFDRVLHRCALNRDRFSSPPHILDSLSCRGRSSSDVYHSNSSLSSGSSSLHGSMELIQVL